MNKQIRQGDVILIPITTEEASAKATPKKVKRENGRIVLAHGEVTGHAHAIRSKSATMFETDAPATDLAPDRILVVEADGVVLEHEEHAKLQVPPGSYVVRRQREYSPQELRQVAD